MFDLIFKNKTVNFEKLPAFGFVRESEGYFYSAKIVGGQLTLSVKVSLDGDIKTTVTDSDSEDEYILHLTTDAVGAFVGKVRTECQNILAEIADNCFETDVFKSEEAHQIIKYVQEKYCDKLEFLWPKFSQNAVLRRKDSQKWYAALLILSKRKLGLDSDEKVSVIDLRGKPEDIEKLIDYKRYFPGYHMNKKHWFTICLDGSVSVEEIYERIDASYLLAKK